MTIVDQFGQAVEATIQRRKPDRRFKKRLQTSANAAPAIVQERSELETARLAAEPDEQPHWESFDNELGAQRLETDQEKREAEAIAALPHETRASSETKENLARLREENTASVIGQRFPGQEFMLDEQASMGRILSAHQFMRQLWKCGLVAVYTKCDTRGLKSLRGDRVARERRAAFERSMAGLVVQGSTFVSIPYPQYVTWVQIPYMPEYSVARLDVHQLPIGFKYRGWRTVLIELIRKGFLAEQKANVIFGVPTGPMARRWGLTMQQIRNAGRIC